MRVGYYLWGFLGDKKFNNDGQEITAPDGNTIYSWSIINELQERGNEVTLFHDRDRIGFNKLGIDLFKSFASKTRFKAYQNCNIINVNSLSDQIFDYMLIEWRWIMHGRNDFGTKANNPKVFQPDYEDMITLIDYCNTKNIPFIVYDLDYKLTVDDIKRFNIKYIAEPGDKFCKIENLGAKVLRVYQPFDFRFINDVTTTLKEHPSKDIIYVGNEYERNWAVEKYLPKGTDIWGNWLEPAHIDSANKFPYLNFHKRVNASELPSIYYDSISTVLLAKKEYAENHFITPRLTESIFYGTVPFFIEEFGEKTISKFAGKYSDFLTVHNKKEVEKKVKILKKNYGLRCDIIKYMRVIMSFIDVKFYVNTIESVLGDN